MWDSLTSSLPPNATTKHLEHGQLLIWVVQHWETRIGRDPSLIVCKQMDFGYNSNQKDEDYPSYITKLPVP